MNYGKIPLGLLVTFGALETQAMAQQLYPQQYQQPYPQQHQMQRPQAGMPHPGGRPEHTGKLEHSEHSEREGKKGHSEHAEHAGHEHGSKEHSGHSGKKEGGEEKLEPVKKELVAKLEESKGKSIHCTQKDGKPYTLRATPMIPNVKKEETKVEKDKGDFDIQYTAAGKKMHIVCHEAAFE